MSRFSRPLCSAIAIVLLTPALGCDSPGSSSGPGPTDVVTDTTSPTDTAQVDTAQPDTTPTDTTAPTDTTPAGVSALTGVNTNVNVTTPTPNPSCAASEVDNRVHGASYPWGGLTVGGKAYTCNKCPNGISDFQGRWRAHGFSNGDEPDYSLGASALTDDAEILYLDGNTFYSKFRDQQTDQSVELRGWFFCAQKPEQANEHLFWTILEATPSGAFGYAAGDVFETDVILSSGADNKLVLYYDSVGASTWFSIGYCRIGTTREGQLCNDPFAN